MTSQQQQQQQQQLAPPSSGRGNSSREAMMMDGGGDGGVQQEEDVQLSQRVGRSKLGRRATRKESESGQQFLKTMMPGQFKRQTVKRAKKQKKVLSWRERMGGRPMAAMAGLATLFGMGLGARRYWPRKEGGFQSTTFTVPNPPHASLRPANITMSATTTRPAPAGYRV
jgi:hypothetical protein